MNKTKQTQMEYTALAWNTALRESGSDDFFSCRPDNKSSSLRPLSVFFSKKQFKLFNLLHVHGSGNII